MPKLGPIQVDDRILDAIRDDRLVVLAGAGVSMGPPANLPSFLKLANDIAAGTGMALAEKEPVDRFLGRLAHKGVQVHERGAQRLTPAGSAPTSLHLDLLRLFRSADRARLVTTNFDLHFETAAQDLFGQCPDVFRAPALPLGQSFKGLVHIHGALTRPHEMVLTDVDFGRAYLTEGWARRFLLEVFRTYTVLFVGYSHDDVVMNYLARALPADSVAGRFALTEEDGDWELLGITPVRFRKGSGADAFKELYDGVRCLAERTTRGVLDWQSRLAEIGSGVPPVDDETVGEIEQALREVHTTRFLVQVARDPGWPKWLNARQQIEALFDTAPLTERDRLLANWLAEHYAIEHADEFFELIAAQNMRLHPEVWWAIGRQLGPDDTKPLRDLDLTRWVAILMTCAPAHADHHVLAWLAAQCARRGAAVSALEVFLFMGEHRFTIKPGFQWPGSEEQQAAARFDVPVLLRSKHYSLNEVWTKHLKPNLAAIAQPLLSGIARRLEDIHHGLLAWNEAGRDWGALTWGRAAIEPHAQDGLSDPIDVLIDAARDTLDWLAENQPALLDAWIERLVVSDVPLLRRLAIHGVAAHPGRSAEDKLGWLIGRVGLHTVAEHHEIYRLAALGYPAAGDASRRAIIAAVLAYQCPDAEDEKAADRTARTHFNWLDWLRQSDDSCALVREALAPIRAAHPRWEPQDHPDLTHWVGTGWVGPQSPWTVEQLLARPPAEQLEDLLTFRGNRFDGPDRDGLIAAVREACKQQSAWAHQLDDALTASAQWASDLWSPVLGGWQEADLPCEDWNSMLDRIARHELHAAHAHDVANLLYSLVRDGGKPFALDLLERANAIAFDVWNAIDREEVQEEIDDWLLRAVNRPAGVIVQFWIHGLSLLLRDKSGEERALPDDYRRWLTLVAQDQSAAGGMGRSLLASQVAFLFALDEMWTREHVIPSFSEPDRRKFAQAWDGFLVRGRRLNPELAEAMEPAFVRALPRLGTDLEDRRRRFIEFFTALTVFHVDDPTARLLPALFQTGRLEDRIGFAAQLGRILRQMDADTRQNLWDRWLHRYWKNRLQAVPVALDHAEMVEMLEWLPHLGGLFPQAVALAVSAPAVQIEHTDLLYALRESELVPEYPTPTAQLLAYLCNCLPSYHATDIGVVARRLALDELPPDLQCSLAEGMARLGCAPGA